MIANEYQNPLAVPLEASVVYRASARTRIFGTLLPYQKKRALGKKHSSSGFFSAETSSSFRVFLTFLCKEKARDPLLGGFPRLANHSLTMETLIPSLFFERTEKLHPRAPPSLRTEPRTNWEAYFSIEKLSPGTKRSLAEMAEVSW